MRLRRMGHYSRIRSKLNTSTLVLRNQLPWGAAREPPKSKNRRRKNVQRVDTPKLNRKHRSNH
jgi:hypothetical protein